MTDKRPILLFSSTVVLTLALHQGALAEPVAVAPPPPGVPLTAPATAEGASPTAPASSEDAASAAQPQSASAQVSPPAAPAPVTTAPATEAPLVDAAAAPAAPPPAESSAEAPQPPPPPAQMDAAQDRMEQRRTEMMEQRNRRYEELRARASEVGLELPETPPWEQTGVRPPKMAKPEMSGGMRHGMTPEDRDAMRAQRYQKMRERAMQRGIELPETPPWMLMSDEERRAHREKMRTMSPEERRAMRDKHWEEMRDRARERGIEMPDTPPWRQAEQRREEMKARWKSYEETLQAMTPEQKEAIEALIGPGRARFSPPAMVRQMPPGMPMQAPLGQQQSYGLPATPGMPGYGAQGAGPSMFEMSHPAPWYDGEQPTHPSPAPHWPGGNEGWLQPPPPPGTD